MGRKPLLAFAATVAIIAGVLGILALPRADPAAPPEANTAPHASPWARPATFGDGHAPHLAPPPR
jgi:hypothetical protein